MRRIFKRGLPVAAVLVLIAVIWAAWYWGLIPRKTYTAADFGIDTAVSPVDYNQNGADDYTDLLRGAKKDAKAHPRYDGSYYEGGYPPENIGVCTDVVWRAFREAGYSLRDMVDADIEARPEAYPNIEKRDRNIDFRRVTNLRIFFSEYARTLTTDVGRIEEWQPGDIVIFGKDKHIGIVSDKRNKNGQPYILHNGGQPVREEDYLPRAEVMAHYRFDASMIPAELLKTF
ncbi:MAG: DUF1287 domain-containing protein [Clostridia bacterium]|nr:DUF1287 domain-containing protein [Clostridia bacterium]